VAEPHPQLRQATPEIREREAGAVHASRNAGPQGRFWRNRWVQAVAFSCAVGVFLSFVGAFGTTRVPLLQRTGMFLGYSLYSGLLSAIVVGWVRRQAWTAARPGLRPVIIAAVMTVLMTLSLWASLGVLAPNAPAAARQLAPLFLTCLVMSAAITTVATAMFRPVRFTHIAPAGAAGPKFLARLPAKLRGAEVWAVQAEDHYLRVHTSRGQELILMRLADAIGELEGIEGAQTHRSWWVARASIHEVTRTDGKIALALPNGVTAPVSRTYAPMLRQAGWL
jgi:hypothetical protein